MKYKVEIQKRFADSDVFGHVNNVNQQHYFDIGKCDFYDKVIGLDAASCDETLITASTSTNYIAQCRFEEPIVVETMLEKIGSKSITLFQQLVNPNSGEVKSESRSVMVAFDIKLQQSIEISSAWRLQFEQSME